MSDPPLVLVVDDEPAIVDLLAMVVEDLGCRVLAALDGQPALALAREEWPALLITDLMLPRLDGAGLIAVLREEAAMGGHPRVPAILITASRAHQATDAGADLVVLKPFDVQQLERAILRFLPSAVSRT